MTAGYWGVTVVLVVTVLALGAATVWSWLGLRLERAKYIP